MIKPPKVDSAAVSFQLRHDTGSCPVKPQSQSSSCSRARQSLSGGAFPVDSDSSRPSVGVSYSVFLANSHFRLVHSHPLIDWSHISRSLRTSTAWMDMKSSWFSWSKTVLQILLQHCTITISEGIMYYVNYQLQWCLLESFSLDNWNVHGMIIVSSHTIACLENSIMLKT